jgi:hypothetical protein
VIADRLVPGFVFSEAARALRKGHAIAFHLRFQAEIAEFRRRDREIRKGALSAVPATPAYSGG